MTPQNPLRSYDDATLAALEEALRDVWQVLKAHDPYPDWQEDPEMKRALAEKRMALADSGVRDSQELRTKTLQSLCLVRPH
jgi:hypothetical protein